MTKKNLTDNAVPTIWPNCPAYLSKVSTQKRSSLNSSGFRLCTEELDDEKPAIITEEEKIVPQTLYELADEIDTSRLPYTVCVVRNEGRLTLISLDHYAEDGCPVIRYSVVVSETLEYQIWKNGVKVRSENLPNVVPKYRLESAEHVLNIINFLEENPHLNMDEESIVEGALKKLGEMCSNKKVDFLREQLSLLLCKPNARRYSNELLANAVLWQNASPACYRQILADGVLTLPTVRHIRRISSALTVNLELTESAIAYLTARKSKLEAKDLLINIVIDEVHCLQQVQYCDGKFYGMENDETTKTLLVVMVRSVAGRYRDVVCMSPTHNISKGKIEKVWMNVVSHATLIGFDIVATMLDGHSSNVSFYESLMTGLPIKNSDLRVIQNPRNPQHLIRVCNLDVLVIKYEDCVLISV